MKPVYKIVKCKNPNCENTVERLIVLPSGHYCFDCKRRRNKKNQIIRYKKLKKLA